VTWLYNLPDSSNYYY